MDSNVKILFNQVPKAWFEYDIYYSLIHNDNEEVDVFEMIPKLGSMEVSTVIKVNGQSADILLFSKMLSNTWPNVFALQHRFRNLVTDLRDAQRGENL